MKFLVDRSDTIEVKVFCYDEDGNVEATSVKSDVPKNVEVVEELRFTFRKPGYGDSNVIIRNSKFGFESENMTADINIFQDTVLRTLLVDWNLKDEEGKSISLNSANIGNLIPSIARAAVSGVMEKIKF